MSKPTALEKIRKTLHDKLGVHPPKELVIAIVMNTLEEHKVEIGQEVIELAKKIHGLTEKVDMGSPTVHESLVHIRNKLLKTVEDGDKHMQMHSVNDLDTFIYHTKDKLNSIKFERK